MRNHDIEAAARDAFAHEPDPLRFEPTTWRELLEELPGLFAAILFGVGIVAFISAVWG